MLKINYNLTLEDLSKQLENFWTISGEKIKLIEEELPANSGAPVFTVNGKYTNIGWTEWTLGFQYGSALLQYDATGEDYFLKIGKNGTMINMSNHLTHKGVHDHGFNNLSTYGNLLRLMKEGKISKNEWERNFYELALKVSGAVQASRWTSFDKGGFIYSFNGPHSLFVDTIRSVRILMVSHMLGQHLYDENDLKINLFERGIEHIKSTADYSVYYGEGRDLYDVVGRVAHESIFNINNGTYRCPGTQQGYSGRTTWTRGLAWALLGFAEELEFLDYIPDIHFSDLGDRQDYEGFMLKAAEATADYYIENTPSDGIPYWDTGAPGLVNLDNYLDNPSDPFNPFEPVDSSAATIAGQGLLRLGKYLEEIGHTEDSKKYYQAGITVLKSLLEDTYLSQQSEHQGLILHSVYHRPNGWDQQPAEEKVPHGESSMWGDYHMREFVLYANRMIKGEPYYSFFNCIL